MMEMQTLCELHRYTNILQGSWDPLLRPSINY